MNNNEISENINENSFCGDSIKKYIIDKNKELLFIEEKENKLIENQKKMHNQMLKKIAKSKENYKEKEDKKVKEIKEKHFFMNKYNTFNERVESIINSYNNISKKKENKDEDFPFFDLSSILDYKWTFPQKEKNKNIKIESNDLIKKSSSVPPSTKESEFIKKESKIKLKSSRDILNNKQKSQKKLYKRNLINFQQNKRKINNILIKNTSNIIEKKSKKNQENNKVNNFEIPIEISKPPLNEKSDIGSYIISTSYANKKYFMVGKLTESKTITSLSKFKSMYKGSTDTFKISTSITKEKSNENNQKINNDSLFNDNIIKPELIKYSTNNNFYNKKDNTSKSKNFSSNKLPKQKNKISDVMEETYDNAFKKCEYRQWDSNEFSKKINNINKKKMCFNEYKIF